MNTQKMKQTRTAKNNRSNNENSWNNIKELVKFRKHQKLQKKEIFEEQFSNISKILKTKALSSNSVPNEKTIITYCPNNFVFTKCFKSTRQHKILE